MRDVPRRVISALSCLAALGVVGCDEGGASVGLRIELAPTPIPGSGTCTERSAPLPAETRCISLKVWQRVPAGRSSVRLYRPGDDHEGSGKSELRFPFETAGRVAFDLRDPSGAFDVEMVAYDEAGAVVAAGVAENVALDGSAEAPVRMLRPSRWSCAIEDGALQPRALHAAVELENGEVLIFGGIAGERIGAIAFENAALLERTIEIFDPRTGSAHVVPVEGEDPGFGRVFFAHALLPRDDGRFQIRVFGGFDPGEGQPAVRFDALQSSSYDGAPLLPSAREGGALAPAPTVDLVYDPATRRVRVEATSQPTAMPGGMNALSERTPGSLPAALLLGVRDSGARNNPNPNLAQEVAWIAAGGGPGASPTTMLAPRFGASVARLGRDGRTIFVWGGNVASADEEALTTDAGEVLAPGASPLRVNGEGIPRSTAFHSATTVGAGVLVFGGLEVRTRTTSGLAITTAGPARPARFFLRDGADDRLTADYVNLDLPTPATILHAALALPWSSSEVLIVGGSVRSGDDPRAQFEERGTSVIAHVLGVGQNHRLTPTGDAVDGLIAPRFGHALTFLAGRRALVTGGLRRSSDRRTLSTLGTAETLYLPEAVAPVVASQCVDIIE